MLDRYDQDLLLDYLEGELDADRFAQLQVLLAQDPQLATLLGAMARDRDALRSLPHAQAPADLTHDVTLALERRMLLDDAAIDTGPIPIGRGRDLPGEAAGGLRWGRIAGLSALAASVALAAGIVVTTINDDPLTRTAKSLADHANENGPADAAKNNSPIDAKDNNGQADNKPESLNARDATNALRADGASADPGKPGSVEPRALERSRPLTADRSVDGAAADPGTIAAAIGRPSDTGRLAANAQRAAALAVTEPRRQLVLFTEEPDLTREQLVAYCVTNGIPIVQTNLPANNNGYAYTDPNNKAVTQIQPLEQSLDGNYALLVDDQMLDRLVTGLNTEAALTADKAANVRHKSAPTQVAILTELSDHESAKLQRNTLQQQPDHINEVATPQGAPLDGTTAQQPIEIRLPQDLGSRFANTLNRNNFDAEQQRSDYNNNVASQPADKALAAKDDDLRNSAAPTSDPQGNSLRASDDPDAGEYKQLNPGDLVKEDAGVDPAVADNTVDEAALPAPQADRLAEETPQPKGQADSATLARSSTRDNWLSPHLPLAETTPILTWRRVQSQRAPQLVPIVIQRTPTEQVQSLRLQQDQLNLREAPREDANLKTTQPPAETTEPGADAEANQEALEQPPAETAAETADETPSPKPAD